ncbi:ATP-dependent Zn protease [Synechocystis sp. LKSZ1]|uniref:ATP-dependent Zn protease n=1 Tax=Synechocystis sp. LKSZ1 TaxID=3144951 RepID=UPI00336BBB74
MSDTTINAVAIAIFAMTLSALLGPLFHLSPLLPALGTLGVLGLVTADQLGWEGKGTNLLLNFWASPAEKQRQLHHEAGHFLVAYCLGIPVLDYQLGAWQVFRRGQAGQTGVQFDLSGLDQSWQDFPLLLERWSTVWMAGIAAEQLQYGQAQGGQNDRQQLQQALALAGLPPQQWPLKERWALLQAKNYLQRHTSAHQNLMQAMAEGASVATCHQVLQNSLDLDPSLPNNLSILGNPSR